MSTSKFLVAAESNALATRAGGRELRERLLASLHQVEHVIVDFSGVTVTPSFADEFLGRTLEELGKAHFKDRLTIINLAESAKPLVRHVLNQRAKSVSAEPLHQLHT